MLNKRNKKDNIIVNDENPSDKNIYLLTYQNKSLCSLLSETKKKLTDKETQLKQFEHHFTTLSTSFTNMNNQITQITNICSQSLENNNLSPIITPTDREFSSPSDILIAILNQKEIPSEFEFIKDLQTSIKSLITHILPLIKENPNINLCDANENRSRLEHQLSISNKNYTKTQEELESLKVQYSIAESKLNEMIEQNDKLKNENFNLKRKINTSPMKPYIIIEENLFNMEKEDHDCVCLICGKGMEDTPNQKDKINEDIVMSGNEETKVKDDESYKMLIQENEALKKRIRELHESLGKISSENDVTEEKLISSRAFQSLITQAEGILLKLNSLSEENSLLKNENFNYHQNKENEINQLNQQFMAKVEEFKLASSNASRIIEENKHKIESLMNKIQSLENIIKAKGSTDLIQMYESFSSERDQLLKQLVSIREIKTEYLEKLGEEWEKNKTNKRTILKLSNEIESLKSIIEKNNISIGDKKKEYDINNEIINRKKKKIALFKEENAKLQSQLEKERNQNENLLELLQSNQTGITSLNTVIKKLNTELEEVKQTQASMSNEKLKDKQTIMLLRDKISISADKMNTIQEQVENYKSFTQQLEKQLVDKTNLITVLNQTLTQYEIDIENLKKQCAKDLTLIQSEKTLNENYQKQIVEYKKKQSELKTNYDVMKIKCEQAYKEEAVDLSLESYEKMKKENSTLEEVNKKYREMLHCKVCKANLKNVVITKCFHVFCQKCIEKTINSRQRKCPICRAPFDQNSVQKIYWD